jgi:hypothetical protein
LEQVLGSASVGNRTGVYLVEDDYLHAQPPLALLDDALARADYATLYDHPDKYLATHFAGGHARVLQGARRHWRTTDSTTMTFGARAATLRADAAAIRPFVAGTHPHDFQLFRELVGARGRVLVSALPGAATHGESAWLSPFVDWSAVAAAA